MEGLSVLPTEYRLCGVCEILVMTSDYLLRVKTGWSFPWRQVQHAVVQMVEAVRCKPEGRGFDSLRCHRNFSTQPEIGGKCGRCLGLVILPPTYADSLGSLGASFFWNPQGLSGVDRD